ncbi:helix-turn-helix domain-containing protein [Amycolatopsis acidicola]|uniref:Helix-turn-helix domain-containing protein n=1 Tax=Amycolatopsis acidicola TaxID=2596893 RepID=A0A5N0UW32_9PSEU|nr:IclR family transcriptional regulator C-terminal domain-containing protein [Amycolatopsis acidicola]KAA9155017.1 helix-turn-helix domain-containing protein [Amycolatopsis acidicola]
MVKTEDQKDYVQSLERGLSVILAFSDHRPQLTLSEVAELTALSRPTVRRLLLTLEQLGYVRSEGRYFSLTPHVLGLGYAYLSSLNLTEVAQPFMEEVTKITGQTCSLSALDGHDAVFLARVPAKQVMRMTLTTGTRLPAFATSMGRVLLAGLPEHQLEETLCGLTLSPLTAHTVTDTATLRERLAEVREQGWALVDQEFEEGVRSLSAPVRDTGCRVIATLSMSVPARQYSLEDIKENLLPVVRDNAHEISKRLGASVSR